MNCLLKSNLIAMIAISVVSDSMLLPFYPQFFATVFAVADPQLVGLYLGATSFVVMLAFPFWAAVAKLVPVIRLLIYTQFAAGVLSIVCYLTDALTEFWLVSLLMLIFKGSYLLIYPHIMRFEQKEKHSDTIGLLSVIVHLGAILGAGTGGFVLQLFEPRQVFLLMSAGDFLQMLICFFLTGQDETSDQTTHQERNNSPELTADKRNQALVYKLGLVMLIFYFSIWLVRQFFSRYWEFISTWNGEIISGLVFAIPGIMALLALCMSKGRNDRGQDIMTAVLLGIFGLFLQASQQETVVLLGRCFYGWALFQATVRLDLLLFEISTPASYASDFSKIYFFQSLGALLALLAAGSLVATYDLKMPFIAGALGWALTFFWCSLFFKTTLKPVPAV